MVTDHKPLKIFGPKTGVPAMTAGIQRWALLLSSYSYNIEFRKSKEHANADTLSRLLPTNREEETDVYRVHFVEKLPLTAQAVSQATKTDPILARVYKLRVWLA